jgi:hypothetical protein
MSSPGELLEQMIAPYQDNRQRIGRWRQREFQPAASEKEERPLPIG